MIGRVFAVLHDLEMMFSNCTAISANEGAPKFLAGIEAIERVFERLAFHLHKGSLCPQEAAHTTPLSQRASRATRKPF
jgi:hypothetical protein